MASDVGCHLIGTDCSNKSLLLKPLLLLLLLTVVVRKHPDNIMLFFREILKDVDDFLLLFHQFVFRPNHWFANVAPSLHGEHSLLQ